MNKKKNLILLIPVIIVIFIVSLIFSINYNSNDKIIKNELISVYFENGYKTGKYTLAQIAKFPDNSFALNASKSTCINGGQLSWDSKTKKLSIVTNIASKCSVYFDVVGGVNASLETLGLADSVQKDTTPDFSQMSPIYKNFSENWEDRGEYFDITGDNSGLPILYSESYTFDKNTGLYYLNNPQTCTTCYDVITSNHYVLLNNDLKIITKKNDETHAGYALLAITGVEVNEYNSPSYNGFIGTKNYTVDNSNGGIYTAEDDYGTSYYFRGAVENNYVKFAGFYWRIIRLNGDGSLRIMFDGSKAYRNSETGFDEVIPAPNFNENYDSIDVEYMNELSNSMIKTTLDNWYKINIEDKGYSSAISDTLFCNDTGVIHYDDQGQQESYLGYYRFSNSTPSLKCSDKYDTYTVEDIEKGNGKLTYPVGLITSDELVFAGIIGEDTITINSENYLYKSSEYWSMTPGNFWGNTHNIISVYQGNITTAWPYGHTHAGTNYEQMKAAPVINLKPEYVLNMSGTGTMDDPYTVDSYLTLASLGLAANYTQPDFSKGATTDEGIFSSEDDYGTSYYFRGAVENNYVKFAGYYWRIVRINGDGSLRIIYDGTSYHKNGELSNDQRIGVGIYNSYVKDNSIVGYMYGLAGATTDANRCLILENDTVIDKKSIYGTESQCISNGGTWTTKAYEATHANVKSSKIKEQLDTWYESNIINKGYSNAISDTLFCNDRSIVSGSGTGDTETNYGVNGRLSNSFQIVEPTFICPNHNDTFTVSVVNGNGDLTYPIGLITADEVVFAGGNANIDNTKFYLHNSTFFWTMTPDYFRTRTLTNSNTLTSGWMAIISEKGSIHVNGIANESALSVVPVINLTKEYARTLKGSGTQTDPFTAS